MVIAGANLIYVEVSKVMALAGIKYAIQDANALNTQPTPLFAGVCLCLRH